MCLCVILGLASKIYDQKADPTAHDSNGRIRAREHKGQKLVTGSPDQPMDEGTVRD